ncbi:hypothetical protein NC652_037650 [Populus alba x Populus x berolinensis]|nr:hypothetical protein NC652_037650 [Populus alba x Populus x berolinensis]
MSILTPCRARMMAVHQRLEVAALELIQETPLTELTAHDCVKKEAPMRPSCLAISRAQGMNESYTRQLTGCPEEIPSSTTSCESFCVTVAWNCFRRSAMELLPVSELSEMVTTLTGPSEAGIESVWLEKMTRVTWSPLEARRLENWIMGPMVSGTYIITNTTASTAMPARIRKVEPVPTASAIERKVWATIRLEIQLTVADMPPHIPRYCSGYISEFTVHGTGPIPGEKQAIYRANPKTAIHP